MDGKKRKVVLLDYLKDLCSEVESLVIDTLLSPPVVQRSISLSPDCFKETDDEDCLWRASGGAYGV